MIGPEVLKEGNANALGMSLIEQRQTPVAKGLLE